LHKETVAAGGFNAKFKATMSSYRDIEAIMKHFDSQDAELLRHTKMLEHLLEATRNQKSHNS
jgi:hypothetical protein